MTCFLSRRLAPILLLATLGCVGKSDTTTIPPPAPPSGNGAAASAGTSEKSPAPDTPPDVRPPNESAPAEPSNATDDPPTPPVEPGETAPSSESAPGRPEDGSAPPTQPSPPQETVSLVDEPREMPLVVLSEGHAATCKLRVGDEFPQLALPDFEGVTHELSSLFGERLTVVIFWRAANPYSVYELKDVAQRIATPLADAGVKVIAVDVRDPLELARSAAEVAGGDITQLHDAQGQLYDAVATGRLPRTYLLDTHGKILWFDLEYSLETRRHLLQAVHFALKP